MATYSSNDIDEDLISMSIAHIQTLAAIKHLINEAKTRRISREYFTQGIISGPVAKRVDTKYERGKEKQKKETHKLIPISVAYIGRLLVLMVLVLLLVYPHRLV